MNEKNIELTIFDIINAIKRKKVVFLTTFFLILFLSLGLIFILPEKYETYAILEFSGSNESQSNILNNLGFSDILNLNNTSSDLETEIGKLKLDSVIYEIVKKMNLTQLANENKTLYQKLRKITITDIDMIQSLKNKIKIESYKLSDEKLTSNLIKISLLDSNPTFSASVILNLYESYYKYSEKQFLDNKETLLTTLTGLYSEASQKSDFYYNKLMDFKKENFIDESNSLKIFFDKYYSLEIELNDFENKIVELEQQIEMLENQYFNMDKKYKLKLLLNTDEISYINKSLTNDKLEYETLKLTSPNNPKILQLENKISIEEEFLKNKIEEILKDNLIFMSSVNMNDFNKYVSLKYQLENISIEKNSLIKLENKIKELISEKSDLLKTYLEIKEKYENWHKKEITLKNYIDQEKIKKLVYEPKLKMIDKVYIPTNPVAPNKVILLGISIFFSLIISFIKAFVSDLKDTRVKDMSIFSRMIKVPDFVVMNEESMDNIHKKILSHIISTEYNKVGILKVGSIKINLLGKIDSELMLLKNDRINIYKIKRPEDMSIFNSSPENKINIFELPPINDYYIELYIKKLDAVILLVEEFESDIENIKDFIAKNNIKNLKIVYIKK